MTEKDKEIQELRRERDALVNKVSVLNYMLSKCISEFNGLLRDTSKHQKAVQEVLNELKSPVSDKKN